MKTNFMARLTRIGLDMALVSIKTVRPAVNKLWTGSKNYIIETSAKRLVNNAFVAKTENLLQRATDFLETKITTIRDRQIPKEIEYLENEIQNVKDKIKKDSTCKALKPAVGTAWQYAKIEMVPPFTTNLFNGPSGRNLEEIVSNAANGVISSLQNMIRNMDAEKERLIRQKEEAIRIAQEKIKAEAKKAAEKARAQAAKIKAEKAPEPQKDKPKDIAPKAKPVKKPKPIPKK